MESYNTKFHLPSASDLSKATLSKPQSAQITHNIYNENISDQ
jgi:hypothetical protein